MTTPKQQKNYTFKLYKAMLEEHRFLQDLSWKIFGISTAILFATPVLLLKDGGLFQKNELNLFVGISGVILTFTIGTILFNYRRRENNIEQTIIDIEQVLHLRGLNEIRIGIQDKPYFTQIPMPMWTKIFHKNMISMALIFFGLLGFYALIIIAQFIQITPTGVCIAIWNN